MKDPIQVHEYKKLRIGEQGFKKKHFNALTSYNDKHGKEFFKVGHKHIQFTSFVGVIQVLDLTIEIMPKINLNNDDINEDKKNLIKMLKICKNVPLSPTENARQRIRRNSSLLDLFFIKFLDDTESILHRGLKKKYKREQSNQPVLKGKLIFSKHIGKNLIHKERFYTEHTVYNKDMQLNQLLKRALLIIANVTRSSDIKNRASDYLLFFDGIKDNEKVTNETFRKIRFTRHNEYYKEALTLAEMIILQYSPQISGGKTPVLAILFQMHRLFEEFVYRKFKQMLPGYDVVGQNSFHFWKNHRIRPDIVVKNGNEKDKMMVLDTKWKVFSGVPKDSDIQQMYVYCKRVKTLISLLIYPGEDTRIVVDPQIYIEDNCKMGVATVNVMDILGKDPLEVNLKELLNICF